MTDLKTSLDRILGRVTSGPQRDRVPGVVAMVTNRQNNTYEGAAGVRSLADDTAMTTNDVFAIFSTTKAIGGTAVMQCVEEGLLDLDAPAKKYAPEIGELQVLEGFDADGNPKLRAPRTEITTRMLMLHTAGLGYDFFNEHYNRLARDHRQPSVVSGTRAALKTPLLFDPGEKWEYGTNVDWAGQVVEGIRGKRLGEVLKERVFDPLGMSDIAFTRTGGMKARTVTVHARAQDGALNYAGYPRDGCTTTATDAHVPKSDYELPSRVAPRRTSFRRMTYVPSTQGAILKFDGSDNTDLERKPRAREASQGQDTPLPGGTTSGWEWMLVARCVTPSGALASRLFIRTVG